ncbi:glucocorticoid modulatory element-binding protein 1-like [Parambassis ranga]|uniref:Glucocorticoid modulatory element-binding protein 1-like n=1 Tax=Parambassis ranga TaxID=210632 RepID=A0A6P7JYT3_9TELE|nr:glucocorticoid modulatory element-binding protein 1-like [Parambassis ranga]
MAGAEVTMSSGELMTVKEEEGEHSSNDHKTPVILHLQPIVHGMNADIAHSGTTLLAIETHPENSKADGEEVEYGYPITCGDSRAVLLFKKFVCPGINVRCVKFNDQLISPKQFVHLAGKATLKDWKRAIRLGGVMLRKMMDSGQIDFYQHDTVCSNTCRSTKFDVLINSARLPPGSSVQPSLSCLALDPVGGQVPPLTGDVHDAAEVVESLEDKFSATSEWNAGPPLLMNPTPANGHSNKRRRTETPDGVLSLWRGVADTGLMGEVLSSLQTELLTIFKGVELRSEKANLQETDAVILNSLCEMFGLLDSVKQAVDLRRSQNEENKIHNSVYVLDEILEEQRKQSCDKNTPYKTLKHPRPQHQRQSLSTSMKTSTVIQPLSVASLSAASYAQLFTHFSAFTGQQHQSTRRTDRDGQATKQETGNQEKKQEFSRKEESSGIPEEPAHRDLEVQEQNSHIRSEESKGLDNLEKGITGKKTSKKHKSK